MAIDPIISLAFSLFSNPGVYALLLGSGISRSSGIPTGWDIVIDLIRKLAAITGESCEPSPEKWYLEKFGEEPEYGKLLEGVCKTSAERASLLRSYFEPSEKEREEGIKEPSIAHRAIAQLVSSGYVRVIITTNFDRLIEKAIEQQGITPVVVSTSDMIKGAKPLAHSKITIIKANGDYLDTRIRNSPDELERYDDTLNDLLDEIFDQYGLIVCGWSADWDVALRSAIERSPSRRYTKYWAIYSTPSNRTRELINHKDATDIHIRNADDFFHNIYEKVIALRDLEQSHPLSKSIASSLVKRYIKDKAKIINLTDTVLGEANKLYEEYSSAKYSLNQHITDDVIRDRIQRYESTLEILESMLITGCYWGEIEQKQIWIIALERVNIARKETARFEFWERLKYYPSLILLYAGGIAALASNNYNTFASIFIEPKEYRNEKEERLLLNLVPSHIIERPNANTLFNYNNNKVPMSDHLQEILRDAFRSIIPDETEYIRLFDRFEYMLALIYVDFREKKTKSIWGPVGCYVWRGHFEDGNHISSIIKEESDSKKDDWPFLKAGLFDGSYERFKYIRDNYYALLSRVWQNFL